MSNTKATIRPNKAGTLSSPADDAALPSSGAKSRLVKFLAIGSGVMAMVIILGAALLILQLERHAAKQTNHTLSNLDLLVSDQTERTLQTVDLILKDTQKFLETKGPFSLAAFDKTFGTHEVFDLLGSEAGGVTQIDAIGLIDSKGQLVNSSRS